MLVPTVSAVSVPLIPTAHDSGLGTATSIPVIHAGTTHVHALATARLRLTRGFTGHAHMHRQSETILHILDGHAAVLWGYRMDAPLLLADGQEIHIPVDVPHALINLDADAALIAIRISTDPTLHDDLEPMPELDELVRTRAETLRGSFNATRENARRPRHAAS